MPFRGRAGRCGPAYVSANGCPLGRGRGKPLPALNVLRAASGLQSVIAEGIQQELKATLSELKQRSG